MSLQKFGWEAWVAVLAATINAFIAATSEAWFYVVPYWQVSVVGLLAIAIGIWRRRQWWLLLISPIFLAPLGFGAMLLYSCSQGTCL